MSDNFSMTDSAAVDTQIRAPEISSVKYPNLVGWTPRRLLSAASTNLTSVKAAKGAIGFISVWNTNAAARYLKLYDKASAPVVASDIPIMTIPIPAGGPREIQFPGGLLCSLGIAYAMTVNIGDTDATAVAAGDITGMMGYL